MNFLRPTRIAYAHCRIAYTHCRIAYTQELTVSVQPDVSRTSGILFSVVATNVH